MSFEDVARRMKGRPTGLATSPLPPTSTGFQFGSAMIAAQRSRTTGKIVLGLLLIAAGVAAGGFTYLS